MAGHEPTRPRHMHVQRSNLGLCQGGGLILSGKRRWIVVESRDLFLYRENLSFCLESKIELNQQKREHETQQTENLINHLKW